jgi:ribonuclease Z
MHRFPLGGQSPAIIALARDADLLFIESSFADADVDQASRRAHLTTTAAGEIARAAGVRRVEAFHFSPRYEGEEERLLAEVHTAFAGAKCLILTPLDRSRSQLGDAAVS